MGPVNVFSFIQLSNFRDMFYISPYYPSLQVVFHSIALYIGIIPGNIVYLFCVCLGAALIHVILQEKVPEAVDKPGVS